MIHRACGCSDKDIGPVGLVQLDGPCPPDREDYEGARDIVASDWLAGVIADAKAEERERIRLAIEAACRLVSPDHLTPMGKRMILAATRAIS